MSKLKNVFSTFTVAITIFMTCSVCSGTHSYTSTQLTENDLGDYGPKINVHGYVVWYGYDGSDYEIFLYDGSSIVQLTDNEFNDSMPGISGNGHVVWNGGGGYKNDSEIFLYDGTDIIQLTDNDIYDGMPRINANGHIVWNRGEDSYREVFLYDGTDIIQLTDNEFDDGWPVISANGYVVWQGSDGSDYEIFLYDGTGIVRLTDNEFDDEWPRINAHGLVLWHGSDGSDYEIFLYDGTGIVQLTDNDVKDSGDTFNANGHVVWCGYDGSDEEIFLAGPDLTCEPVSGIWNVTLVTDETDCGGRPDETGTDTYTITQDGCSVEVADSRGTYTGIIDGNKITWAGSFPEDEGRTTILNLSLTLSGDNIAGSSLWTWISDDTTETCSGTTQISGTRETGTNPVEVATGGGGGGGG